MPGKGRRRGAAPTRSAGTGTSQTGPTIPRGRKRNRPMGDPTTSSMEALPSVVSTDAMDGPQAVDESLSGDDAAAVASPGSSSEEEEEEEAPPSGTGSGARDDGDDSGDDGSASSIGAGSHRSASPGRLPAPPKLCLGLALALWVFEFLAVVALKRWGMLQHDFRLDRAVKEQLAPHLGRLQSQIEQGLQLNQYVEQILAQFNETALLPLAYLTQEKKRPGFQLVDAEGAQAHYPIVMVPGFVTSGLEVWAGKPCARKHFRQRLWAAIGGAHSFFTDRDCWRQHMMLDPETGSDPEEIRLRAAQGFEAADFFMANYWVWNKLIENLADVGYTPSTMALEAYDWRLAYPLLEERDGYFSRLKSRIEDMHRLAGRKVVLTSHSMGALVVHHFFAWVTASQKDGGRGAGSHWVDEHLHAFINIAGAHLGVPKATTAILSGEMSDTALLGTFGNMVEQFFGRRLRRDLWASWGSLWTMLPKGGNALWSPGVDMCQEWSKDDPLCPPSRCSPLITMTDSWTTENVASFDGNWSETTINETLIPFLTKQSHQNKAAIDFLTSTGGGFGENVSSVKLMSFDGRQQPSSKTWHDPTITPLPYAPNLKIYCLYGTGLDTERAYYYRRNIVLGVDDGDLNFNISDPPLKMDLTIDNATHKVKYGVRYANGDGSVPLISLGYICADAWVRRESGLNPSSATVYTREYEHHAEFSVDDPMRAGPRSADHVDILGNIEMVEDFLRIVTDSSVEKVNKDQIISDIKEIANRINAHELGGLRKASKKFGLF